MSNSTKLQKINAISDIYNEEDFIDAKDNQGDWRVGYIVTKNQITKTFKVRFDGWASKYDEIYKFSSAKLSPFRTKVIGYTGQKQNPGVRDGWKLDLDKIQKLKNQVQKLFIRPEQYSVHQINQILRGHNYLYVDFLMTIRYPNIESFSVAMKYFLLNIDLVVVFLKHIESDINKYLILISNQGERQASSSEAFAYIFYEIFDTIYAISGNYSRLSAFFKDNAEFIKEFYKQKQKKDIKELYQYQIVLAFAKQKGFDIFRNILIQIQKVKRFVPYLFLYSLANFFYGLSSFLSISDRQLMINQFHKIAINNMDSLKDTDFKDFHKHEVTDFLKIITQMAENSKIEEQCNDWVLQMELQLCLKMIKCPYFQKKLKGIHQIISICDKNPLVFKNDFLHGWISKVKLFEILFVNNDNPQLVKKSAELAKNLFIKHNLKQQYIDLIWQSREGKHETVLKEIYHFFSQLPIFQSKTSQNVKLFSKVSQVPSAAWDEDYINLIREFSENAVGRVVNVKNENHFGMSILYRYCLQIQSQFSVEQLICLLKKFQKSQMLQLFQKKCFKEIRQNKSAEVHILILNSIVNNRLNLFDKVEDKNDILVHYLINNSSDENKIKTIEQAFQLLTNIYRTSKEELKLKEVLGIWKAFINCQSTARDIFLSWLYKKKDNGRYIINQIISDDNRRWLIDQLWPVEQVSSLANIKEDETLFFIQLFKAANSLNRNIKRMNVVFEVINSDLDGYQIVWMIFRQAKNEKVVHLVAGLIAEVYTSMHRFEDVLNSMIGKIIGNIKEALKKKDDSLLERLLILVKTIISRDEQAYSITQNVRINFIKEYTITCKHRNEEKTFRYNSSNNFYQFKKIVAAKFGMKLHLCQLVNQKNEIVGYQNYFKSMNETQLGTKFEVIELQDIPSKLKISFNKSLDLFFELLGDVKISKIVWGIVQKLPISFEVKEKIQNTQNILLELSNHGFYKELYLLKVIEDMDSQNLWFKNFSTEANLQLLSSFFSKIQLKSDIEQQYINIVAKIMLKIIRANNQCKINNIVFNECVGALKRLLVNICNDKPNNIALQQNTIKTFFGICLNTAQKENSLTMLLEYKDKVQLLTLGSMKLCNNYLKNAFCFSLKLMLGRVNGSNVNATMFFLILQSLEIAISLQKYKDNMKEYFQFLTHFLNIIKREDLIKFITKQNKELPMKIFSLIKNENEEISSENVNISLVGYLSILKFLSVCLDQHNKMIIAQYIIHFCLFSNQISKCKSKEARNAAFSLLQSLMVSEAIIKEVCNFLIKIHQNGGWRTRKYEDWSISATDKIKSSTGYVGLKNLGCICYMNSFFQQIFMIPKFRRNLLACEDPNFKSQEENDNILFQVQRMFLNLQLSENKFFNPKTFCHAFKDYDGNPTNVSEQMDIDQFSGILFDRLENQMKNTPYSNLIKQTFGGVFSNEIVCKGCPHFSETQQNFLSISLTVKAKKNIYQSFDTMIKGDNLDGDNAYFCERCNKKVSAVKRVSVKKLPNNLIITLKRFQFDYETMTKLKVNDFCQFPTDLNLKEYSRQFLRKQQSSKVIEEEEVFGDDYYKYVLKGVVVHLGYADSGHYYSYIQDRESKKWYEFNDTVVKKFSIDNLAEETFGGESSGYDSRQKIKNAYMLIYERQSKLFEEIKAPETIEQILSMPVYRGVIKEIQSENKQQKIQNILFSYEYAKYLSSILAQLSQFSAQLQQFLFKYALTVFLTVNIRERSDQMTNLLLKQICSIEKDSPLLSNWVLSLFCQEKVYIQFFKSGINRDRKKYLTFWLCSVFKKSTKTNQIYFINLLLNRLVQDNENASEVCIILNDISKDQQWLNYLIQKNIIGRMIENINKVQKRQFRQKLDIIEVDFSELGNQIIAERARIDAATKHVSENENGYVWEILNRILNWSSNHGVPLGKYISQEEILLLDLSSHSVYKILEELKNKHQIKQFTSFLSFKTIDNKENLIDYANFVCKGLKQFHSKRYRQFFFLFQKLIQVQDKLKSMRFLFFKKIIQALKHNQQYSLDSNILHQWVIMLVNRNFSLKKHLLGEKDILDYLHKQASRKIPTEDIAKKNTSYGQSMINKLHGIKFPKSKKGYIKLCKEMEEFYDDLIENGQNSSTKLWPLADECEQRLAEVGDKVAYFDTKEQLDYQECLVKSIFLGKYELVSKNNKIYQIWKDDQKINLELSFVPEIEEYELDSSRTTEMDIEDNTQDLLDET